MSGVSTCPSTPNWGDVTDASPTADARQRPFGPPPLSPRQRGLPEGMAGLAGHGFASKQRGDLAPRDPSGVFCDRRAAAPHICAHLRVR